MEEVASPAAAAPSLVQGRLCILSAAVLWSLSGGFVKVLTQPTGMALDKPALAPLQLAFFRALFAGLAMLPMLRRGDVSFRGPMLGLGACFALMNALFVLAMVQGTAANAILLQYTAPMWMYLASVWWLGEAADRRSSVALGVGLLGVAVIVIGGWGAEQLPVVALGLGSGLTYAGVMVQLRVLRDLSSRWLTLWNLLWAAVVLTPFVGGLDLPSPAQLGTLFLFGVVQMALPYWLVARGLRSVSPQEAGTITLLEPILNPVWAWLVSPETETPGLATCAGGALILGALLLRYWPANDRHGTCV